MKRLILLLLSTLLSISGYSWGQKGHDATCAIASLYLTKTTRQHVEEVFNGKHLVYWSNWMDNASHTKEYEYTKTWHYKNIDADQTFEGAPLLETGDIVRALQDIEKALASDTLTEAQEFDNLRYFIHLMGDIHQPMHMGHKSDLGGNRWQIKFFGQDSDLHTIWDTSLVERAHAWSHDEWVEELCVEKADVCDSLRSGDYVLWAKETYNIAKGIYEGTPQGMRISYDYLAEWTPVIEQQFLKGGLRLADKLNTIFDKKYRARNKK